MYTQVVKWFAIAVLLFAVVFWNSGANYQLELDLVVSGAAAVVLIQAVQAKKYRWASGFLAIGLLFNPAVPIFKLAGGFSLSLVVLAIVPFALSLATLRPHPLLSVPSIMDRNPGSQSL